jgi:hypothetical protein
MEMKDPFNYPSLNKKDLMALSTINQERDGQKTSTKNFISKRTTSSNLYTLDIEGTLLITFKVHSQNALVLECLINLTYRTIMGI